MKRISVAVTLAGALTVAGCISPQNFESTPVVVQSAAGPVTCQLYTTEQVIWDRSIDRPASMDPATADSICKREGQRRAGAPATPAPVAAGPKPAPAARP